VPDAATDPPPYTGKRADVICAAYYAAECALHLLRPGRRMEREREREREEMVSSGTLLVCFEFFLISTFYPIFLFSILSNSLFSF
jgi:hypothetical protein